MVTMDTDRWTGLVFLYIYILLPMTSGQESPCDSGPCQNGALCVDDSGGYQCFCQDGYTGSRCEENFDDCASAPCLNGGICLDGVASYTCTCNAWFTGNDCQIDIDACVSSPCGPFGVCVDLAQGHVCQCTAPYNGPDCTQLPCVREPCENEAECIDDPTFNQSTSGYICDCLQGFTGARCQINIDDCDNENGASCSDNGLCVDGINDISCLCEPGWVGDFCQSPVNDCIGHQCRQNSTCQDEHLGYRCECPPGYDGDLCERERDECVTWSPCLNGATCVDNFDDYECRCGEGWYGRNCSQEVNECLTNECLNGAQCLDVVAGFVCRCPPFYTGRLCETAFNPCSPDNNPCQNEANCVAPPDGQYVCFCPSGFTGVHCEINLNECETQPCRNNGTCEDTIASYRCYCTAGWTGQDCHINIDDCQSEPCLNEATCLDLLNGYECNCTADYSGRLCDEVVDYCQTDPCFNDGTCTSELGGYTCQCTYPYTGQHCLNLIDSCQSVPCVNNGTCMNTESGYVCQCPPGFTGQTCNTVIDPCDSAPCLNGGTCRRVIEGFVCICPDYLTGRQCTDLLDYCKDNPCSRGGVCINDEFKYRCLCFFGYLGQNCSEQVDFCKDIPCQNNASCSNVPGGFECSCRNGYTGDLCQSVELVQSITASYISSAYYSMQDPSLFLTTTDFHISSKTQPLSPTTVAHLTPTPTVVPPIGSALDLFSTMYTESLTQTQISSSKMDISHTTIVRSFTSTDTSIYDFRQTSSYTLLFSSHSGVTPYTLPITLQSPYISFESYTSILPTAEASKVLNSSSEFTSRKQQTLSTESISSTANDSGIHTLAPSRTKLTSIISPIQSTSVAEHSSLLNHTSVISNIISDVQTPTIVLEYSFSTSLPSFQSSTLSFPPEMKSSPLFSSDTITLTSTRLLMSSTLFNPSSSTDAQHSSITTEVKSLTTNLDVHWSSLNSICTDMITSSYNHPSKTSYRVLYNESSIVSPSSQETSRFVSSYTLAVSDVISTHPTISESEKSSDKASSSYLSMLSQSYLIVNTNPITGTPSLPLTTSSLVLVDITQSGTYVAQSRSLTISSTLISPLDSRLSHTLFITSSTFVSELITTEVNATTQQLPVYPRSSQTLLMTSSVFSTELSTKEVYTITSQQLPVDPRSSHTSVMTSSVFLTELSTKEVYTITSQQLPVDPRSSHTLLLTSSVFLTERSTKEVYTTTSKQLPVYPRSSHTSLMSSSVFLTELSIKEVDTTSQQLSVYSRSTNTLLTSSSEFLTELYTTEDYTSNAQASVLSLTYFSPVTSFVSTFQKSSISMFTITVHQSNPTLTKPTFTDSIDSSKSAIHSQSASSGMYVSSAHSLQAELSSYHLSDRDFATNSKHLDIRSTSQIDFVSPTSTSSVNRHISYISTYRLEKSTQLLPSSFKQTHSSSLQPSFSSVFQKELSSTDTISFLASTIISTNLAKSESIVYISTNASSQIVSTDTYYSVIKSYQYKSSSLIPPSSISQVLTNTQTETANSTTKVSIVESSSQMESSTSSRSSSMSRVWVTSPFEMSISSSTNSFQDSIKATASYKMSSKHVSFQTVAATLIATQSTNLRSTMKTSVIKVSLESSSTVSQTTSASSTSSTQPTPFNCNNFICQNGGLCRQDFAGTFCECIGPFGGRYCELVENTCQGYECSNGAECTFTMTTFGVQVPSCNCPLPYTGTRCNKEVVIYYPSFNGNSYLELPSPEFLADNPNEIVVSMRTTQDDATIFFSSSQTASDGSVQKQSFIQLAVRSGRLEYMFSCDGILIGTINTDLLVNTGSVHSILIRQQWSDGPGQWCNAALHVDRRYFVSKPILTMGSVTGLGPFYLGGIPRFTSSSIHVMDGFVGCVQAVHVNGRELDSVMSSVTSPLTGRNIENCNVPVCQHNPCKNEATCQSAGDQWTCSCLPGFGGVLCERKLCEVSPCLHGGTCIVLMAEQDELCLCPYGRGGTWCEEVIAITVPQYNGRVYGYSSFTAYSPPPGIQDGVEMSMSLVLDGASRDDSLILFIGNTGSYLGRPDFLVLGVHRGYLVLRYDLGSGYAQIYSEQPLDEYLSIHSVRFGQYARHGWLQVDHQRNMTGQSRGSLTALNTNSPLFVGGVDLGDEPFLPKAATFADGFKGCIFDVVIQPLLSDPLPPGGPPGHVDTGRNIGQCTRMSCDLSPCSANSTCVNLGASIYCNCTESWKGVYCRDQVTACDTNNSCSDGSICVARIPDSIRCVCPLGRRGDYCEQAITINDPKFIGEDSFMVLAPVFIKVKTSVQLQFKPTTTEGIIFYVAQHLHATSGDFLALGLHGGHLELRFSLGTGLTVIRNSVLLDSSGDIWHAVHAGRNATHGFLSVDDVITEEPITGKMTYLDTTTNFYLGGLPHLTDASYLAFEDEPVAFEGCIRELVVNGHHFELTVDGAIRGQNIDDCDNTSCGLNTCKNEGVCNAVPDWTYNCTCADGYYGDTCEFPVICMGHECVNGLCRAEGERTYICHCFVGWIGAFCDTETKLGTAALFKKSSYTTLTDGLHEQRNKSLTLLALSFRTTRLNGLIIWNGQTYSDEEDYLGLGLKDGRIRLVCNLGWFSAAEVTSTVRYDDGSWHDVLLNRNGQSLILTVDNVGYHSTVSGQFKDLDSPGTFYFGGFADGRVPDKTLGLFTAPFEGCIRNVSLAGSDVINFDSSLDGLNLEPCNP